MSSPVLVTPARSRRQLVFILSGVLIAATVVGYSLWGWRSAQAAAHVTVVAGPGPIQCNDGELPVRLAEEDGLPGVVVQMKAVPDAWCQVPISVRNDSAHSITVKDMTFPLARLGRYAGGAIVVTGDSSAVGPVGSTESMEAVFKFEEDLDPGEAYTQLMRVEINPNACSVAGVGGLPNVPRVRFSVLHRTHETNGAIHLQAKIGKEGLAGPYCDLD